VSDFIIQIGPECDTERVAAVLRDREHMAGQQVSVREYAWGTLSVQAGRGRGYDPVDDGGARFFCVGRPREVGWTHEDDGAQGFLRRWGSRVCRGVDSGTYEALTGTYVIGACDPHGFRLLTDRIGMYPVYVGHRRADDALCVVGSHPELVAELAGRSDDIDVLSIGEILLRHNTTFPFTTRNGMRELDPGAYHTFTLAADGGSVQHAGAQLWLPAEPDRWPSLRESQDALYTALRVAGPDIARGAERVVATLSGGLDSRAVIGALPREKLVGTVTFINNENRECRVAAEISAAAGVPHYRALRDPEFYATLPERESALVGMERAAVHAHALVVADAGLTDEFDLMVGGFLCDTMLKSYFSPESARSYMAARLGAGPKLRRRWFRPHFDWFSYNRPIVTTALRPDVLDGMRSRLETRLAAIRSYRPETAEEWLMFYPESKNEGANYALVNTRVFCADELYLHRDVLDVERTAHPYHKITKRLVTPVFARVAGPLARVLNANTGLPADVGWPRMVFERRLRAWLGRVEAPPRYEYPWFADHSWIDYHKFQLYSPRWQALRQRALRCSSGLDVLSNVLREDPRSQIETFQEHMGNRFDYKLVQMALHYEWALGGALAAGAPGHSSESVRSRITRT
jgi:hypothetical protein